MPDKSCFVLWSAGVDSTYLILRLLHSGFKVSSAYCEIRNNDRKTLMEKYALQQLSKQILNLFPNSFTYCGTIYSASNYATSNGGIKYHQVPYFMHALFISPITTYRALGYVKGDSAIKNLDNIRSLYNGYKKISHGNFPELIFPLKNIDKKQIFASMQRMYPQVLNNCVWCARPEGELFMPCKACMPCRRRQIELTSLSI